MMGPGRLRRSTSANVFIRLNYLYFSTIGVLFSQVMFHLLRDGTI